jgi:hypothetical protein
MSPDVAFAEIPPGLLIPLAVLSIAQIALEVFALVKLIRTPDDQLVFGKKWPWVLIILFVNFIGAIVFLAAGRTPAAAVDPAAQPGATDETRAARAADVLYGPRQGDE